MIAVLQFPHFYSSFTTLLSNMSFLLFPPLINPFHFTENFSMPFEEKLLFSKQAVCVAVLTQKRRADSPPFSFIAE